MADMFLDAVMDEEESRLDFLLGGITAQEAYDRGIINEQGGLITPSSSLKTCKYCDQEGLVWARHKGKWRLFQNGSIHKCPVNPLRD